MKTFWIILSMCLGIFLIIGISMAFAEELGGLDTDSQTSLVTLVLPHTADLEIVGAGTSSSKTLAKDAGGAEAEYDQGHTDLDEGKPTFNVSANKNWKLSAVSSGFASADGDADKLITDLQLRHTNNTYVKNSFNSADFVSLTASPQEIAGGEIGVKEIAIPCQYRILLDWTKDTPGTYTATVTYTLTTIA